MSELKYNRRAKMNDLGVYQTQHKWTDVAKMCYERGCVCGGCELIGFDVEGKGCQVKAAVLESVRLFGAPFERVEVVMGE